MAESGQSKGLGELFVEFGQKGGSGLMKSLNGISAQFLLTKNTAQQAVNMVKDFSKNALNTTVSMDKFSSVTGISAENLQKWNVWLKLNNYSTEQFLGNIKSLQENMLDIQMGRGNLKGWTLLGLDPHNFDFKKPDEALAAILKRLQQVDEATGALALREMGLSQDLLYLAKQRNNEFNTSLLLNEKELDNIREQQAGWNKLGATWDAAQQKFIANQTWINTLLGETTKWLERQHPILENISNSLQWLYDKGLPKLGEFLGEQSTELKSSSLKPTILTPKQAIKVAQLEAQQKADFERRQTEWNKIHKTTSNPKQTHKTSYQAPKKENISPLSQSNSYSQEITNRGTTGNTMPQPMLVPVPELDNQPSIPEKLPPVPNNLTSFNTSNVININQTINSTADASLVANESASSIRRSLSRVELINPQVV